MEWKEFKESEKQFPQIIIQKQLEGFSKATKSLLDITIQEADRKIPDMFSSNHDFAFDIILYSPFVKGYRFIVFSIAYNVEMYPVTLLYEGGIYSEINKDSSFLYNYKDTVSNEEQLIKEVERIFKSNRFNEVVAGLMKIASEKAAFKGV